jgi:16S rRNA (cytosine967-C5)-methyltransferase
MIRRTARELAAATLLRREREQEYIEDLLAKELAESRLAAPADRALAQELTYGAVRWQATLDWLIQRKTTPGRTQKAALLVLLRLALYQLFWLERIPDHAAVNETVALVKRLGLGPQSGFVNAILRSYLRERDATEQLLRELKVQQPALGYSHPDWLFARWEQRWGRDRAVELMTWNNQPPKTFARVNTLRTAPSKLLELWDSEKVLYEPVQQAWFEPNTVFLLKSHPPLRELASFEKGCFYIQDPSTLLAAAELNPKPGEAILDLCAAPGGKATYVAQLIQNQGEIVAEEIDPNRLRRLRENCERLGATCVRVAASLSNLNREEPVKLFDAVLLDAPCSNTGVMRRRIDLRWRIRPEELKRLRKTQAELVRQAAVHLRPGGRLVYSTCSLEPEENNGVLGAFLEQHPEFVKVSERELLPFQDAVDGAFVVNLTRRA